ncbi:uncharacterized protein LOC117651040 isoform X2 [Thrips palmi]|uniref:Uncharacterized protein LOC117651040 isoform X2 n=1 Tax=Thrips palmi TaxID=161013 RepID=A0A6P8ZYZ0_THRPL|nr:uncharacterized protein LOC117651040 isoform X2 [Thrips palmi]
MARVRWCLMLFEALAYTARRRDLAVLLNGLKAYLHAHPLRTSRWRPLLLFSIITVLPHFALFVGQMSQIPARGAVGTTQAVAYVVLFSVGAFVSACLYMRILCPLAVLRAAAADLRIDWKRAVLAALGEDAIIHDHDAVPHDHNASPPVLHGHDTVLHDYDAGLQSPEAILHNRSIDGHMAALAWRALRQRQLLLHDLVRKSSDANGPCILALLLSLAGLTTGAMDVLESDLNDADVVPALLYYVLFIVYVLAVTAVCQWPATEFQAMAMEIKCLSLRYRRALEPSALGEARSLLKDLERQDNRYDLLGVCHCDDSALTTVMSAVSVYLFTCFVTKGFTRMQRNK